jgi:hypothetical protein
VKARKASWGPADDAKTGWRSVSSDIRRRKVGDARTWVGIATARNLHKVVSLLALLSAPLDDDTHLARSLYLLHCLLWTESAGDKITATELDADGEGGRCC